MSGNMCLLSSGKHCAPIASDQGIDQVAEGGIMNKNIVNALALTVTAAICPSVEAQTTIDELAGTQQRLSTTCAGMVLAASQGPPEVGRHIIEEVNDNLDMMNPGETDLNFIMRFFDFHAERAGFISGQEQSKELIDSMYRVGFLLSQLAASGDVDSLKRIAQGCVIIFREAQ